MRVCVRERDRYELSIHAGTDCIRSKTKQKNVYVLMLCVVRLAVVEIIL